MRNVQFSGHINYQLRSGQREEFRQVANMVAEVGEQFSMVIVDVYGWRETFNLKFLGSPHREEFFELVKEFRPFHCLPHGERLSDCSYLYIFKRIK
jgi:hypothetical protein